MRELWRTFRRSLALAAVRRRFPTAVLHERVVVTDDSSLGDHVVLFRDVQVLGSSVDRYTYIQAGTVVGNCEIGPFCSIAAGVTIGMAVHPTSMVSTSPVFYDPEQPLPQFLVRNRYFTDNFPRTTIGADVWIGQGAMLKAGIRVGIGAVIGAGSIVTKDVAPYEVTAGVPSRRIRSRFPDETVSRLLASRWWMLDDAALTAVADQFVDPEALLRALGIGGTAT